MWGAAWLRKATGDESYLNYIESNREPFGASDNVDEFGWDNKVGGLNILVSKVGFPIYINIKIRGSNRS